MPNLMGNNFLLIYFVFPVHSYDKTDNVALLVNELDSYWRYSTLHEPQVRLQQLFQETFIKWNVI